jgi:hypothetical protein
LEEKSMKKSEGDSDLSGKKRKGRYNFELEDIN